MSKPVLMLDVDGVIAPFGLGGECPENHYEQRFGFGDMTVFLANDLANRIRRLQRCCDLMWATAWEERANEMLLPHLGLQDELPLIEFDHRLENEGLGPEVVGAHRRLKEITFDPGVLTWKLPWIKQWAEMNPDRPFVWIDDEIEKDAFEWADAREVPTKFICTDPRVGMTEGHANVIELWAIDLDQPEEDVDVPQR